MGSLAVALGAMAWWVAREADHRVLRGRLAADLQAGLLELSTEKLRLQTWSLEMLMGAAPDPTIGEAITGSMIERIAALRATSDTAERLDRARGKDPAQHARRRAALATLQEAVLSLRAQVAALPGQLPPHDLLAAWGRLDALFSTAEATDLRQILRAGIRAEAASVAEERVAADASLRRVRVIVAAGTATLVTLALALALLFTAALRRPVQRLRDGAAALAQGDLDHRIGGMAEDEFGELAACMNRMSADLARSHAAERALRAGLEREVASRTQDLSHALDELAQAETQRRQLLADIGHELRTPATVIRGEVEVALRARSMDEAGHREVLARIRETALELGVLVEDVLVLASAEAAALSVDLSEVQAGPQVLAVVQAGRVKARDRSVALRHIPARENAILLADAGRLRQVAGILVDNAMRYGRTGSEVVVSETIDHATATWRLEVLDRGIGVEAEEVPRLFERGYRSAAAREHRADGTGLGLAIARALTDRLGGEVTLAPREGGGTVARLSLPVIRHEAAA
ncbi:cell wall metabolism sensor histidine kinase WalK [Elioraea sp.]|uniref:sensor histidine kinase n=1 Tax=Elioraea sp. TaxID=2185103 RepID=UPI0025BE2D47|nr:sensor histidine kinase [Elioraea sp.]